MKGTSTNEAWGSRIGLILAMAGNAVGLRQLSPLPDTGRQQRRRPVHDHRTSWRYSSSGSRSCGSNGGWAVHGGRYRKGHIPGMFATVWKHPLAKYLGVLGLVIPLVVLIYYTYI